MWKVCLMIFSLCFCQGISAIPPESVRRVYALKMHEAFIQQSVGLATQAFFTFKDGYQEALQSGESIHKVQTIEKLFYWYRHYGSSLGLMARPSQVTDEYRGGYSCVEQNARVFQCTSHQIPDYYSEWGKDPEQAKMIRDFMFGVGEVISGVLCISIGTIGVKAVGGQLVYDGCSRMWSAGNSAWAYHQEAILELQKWEGETKRIVGR
jgi:hypothetical protein